MLSKYFILSLIFACLLQSLSAAEITIPATTAYLQGDDGGARVTRDVGITNWKDPKQIITWFGKLNATGNLRVSVRLRQDVGTRTRLKMTVAGEAREISSQATGDQHVVADFGEYEIAELGYQSFTLESLGPVHPSEVSALVIDGPASQGAHFNLLPRRNAASVHLSYPVEKGIEVSAFYCEMTAVEDPLWTYYMACGWHRGYFGMQVNSPTERRIIFSVWDSGGEAIDRKKVASEDRVQLVAKGDDVFSGSFGNEGTGGHSHLKFNWKTGQRQRFLVTAESVSESHTVFAGYYFRPDLRQWMLISSWNAPKEGKLLRGLYSFSENFAGRNGHILRKALYENQWIRTAQGEWIELTEAGFSHDATGKSDRLDRFMGVEDDQFFLSHGGFVDGFTPFGKRFVRRSSDRSPAKMKLPPLPPTKKTQ